MIKMSMRDKLAKIRNYLPVSRNDYACLLAKHQELSNLYNQLNYWAEDKGEFRDIPSFKITSKGSIG